MLRLDLLATIIESGQIYRLLGLVSIHTFAEKAFSFNIKKNPSNEPRQTYQADPAQIE